MLDLYVYTDPIFSTFDQLWATVTTLTSNEALFGAIVGSVVGGGFSLWATQKAHRNNQEHTENEEDKLIRGLILALRAELETILERYQNSAGSRLEANNEGEILNFYYPIKDSFFVCYEGSGHLIGRITDDDLRKKIIKVYTLARGIIMSYQMNNEMLVKYEAVYKEANLKTTNKNVELLKAHIAVLVEYAGSITTDHYSVLSEAKELFEMIDIETNTCTQNPLAQS